MKTEDEYLHSYLPIKRMLLEMERQERSALGSRLSALEASGWRRSRGIAKTPSGKWICALLSTHGQNDSVDHCNDCPGLDDERKLYAAFCEKHLYLARQALATIAKMTPTSSSTQVPYNIRVIAQQALDRIGGKLE